MQYLSIFRLACFLVATAIVCGCATDAEIIKMYDEKSVRSEPYNKLLVVSIATNLGDRRRLEELITGHLTTDGADAVAGHTLMGLTETVLQQDIDDAATKAGADGILVTHIVSVDQNVEFREGRTEVMFECRGGDPTDYFLYDQRELKLPDSVMVAHTVVAVTNVYDVASKARRWTIQSTCFDKASMDEVLQEEANAIVVQLRKDDLIG